MVAVAADVLARARVLVVSTQFAGVYHVQRQLRLTYRQACHVLDALEADGVVGPDPGGDEPRPVLVRPHP